MTILQSKAPNGAHLCLVSQVAGPSIADLSFCPGRSAGYRRLRGCSRGRRRVNLANIDTWSDEQVYSRPGSPVKDDDDDDVVVLAAQEASNTPSSAPRCLDLVQPAHLNNPSLLSRDTYPPNRLRARAPRQTPQLQPSQPQETETALSLPYSAPEVLFNTKASTRRWGSCRVG